MRVPRAILEAQEYRKDVLGDEYLYYDDDGEDYDEDEPSLTGDLVLDQSFATVKERTNYALIQLYEQKGYDIFKQTCLNMKGNNGLSSTDYGSYKGESAEVYLYVTVLEFIKKFDLPWKAYLSLIIPHRIGKEGHTTEIDLVLASQEMITVFESKSYGGDKTLIDKCSIKRKSGTKDIYSQNAMHCESLVKQIADYNINDQRGMKSVLFSFAEGALVDQRELKYKRLMPVVTEDSILKYLTSLSKLEDKYWKATIHERLDELSTKLTMEDHMSHINRNKQ